MNVDPPPVVSPRKRQREFEASELEGSCTKKARILDVDQPDPVVSTVSGHNLPTVLGRRNGVISEQPDENSVSLQLAKDAYELLVFGGPRSHGLGRVVTRSHVQLLYYDRSATLVAEQLDLQKDRRRLAQFFVRLAAKTLAERLGGIVDYRFNGQFIRPRRDLKNDMMLERLFPTYADNGLPTHYPIRLKEDGPTINLKLGDIVSSHHGLIGRSTLVIAVTTDDDATLSSKNLVLKVSFPDATGHDAAELVKHIYDKVGSHSWVKDHLPSIDFHDTFEFTGDHVMARVEAWLSADNRNCVSSPREPSFSYDKRVCRIILQERLFPIQDLTSAEDCYRVILHAVQSQSCISRRSRAEHLTTAHRWIYDHAGLLHRNISTKNIMFRFDENDQVCGVLNDWDLASFPTDEVGLAKRTGTLPFMSLDFHTDPDNPPRHLYRHDLESFLWVLYCVINECMFDGAILEFRGRPDGDNNWNDVTLSHTKRLMLEDVGRSMTALQESADPKFKNGVDIVEELMIGLVEGCTEKSKTRSSRAKLAAPPPFDDETYGQQFTYELFMKTFESVVPDAIKYRQPLPLTKPVASL